MKSHRIGILIAFCAWGWPGAALAQSDFGLGMEYYTVQTYLRGAQGEYYQSLIQSTLGRSRLNLEAGPVALLVGGGWSDWQVSGGFKGSEIPAFSSDLNFNGLHYVWDAALSVRVWEAWEAGLAFEDHALKQYKADGFELLSYRTRAAGAFIRYAVMRTESVKVSLAAVYDPIVNLEFAQSTDLYANQNSATVREYHVSGTGARWSGRITLQYRDSAGWGIDAGYRVGFTRFPSLAGVDEITLRDGALTGTISLLF